MNIYSFLIFSQCNSHEPHTLCCVTAHTSGFAMLSGLRIPVASAHLLVSTGAAHFGLIKDYI